MKTCLKCSFGNLDDPVDPMAACPKCGAIYARVDEARAAAAAKADRAAKIAEQKASDEATIAAKKAEAEQRAKAVIDAQKFIDCPTCRQRISRMALACPHCGHSFPPPRAKKSSGAQTALVLVFGVPIGLAVIIGQVKKSNLQVSLPDAVVAQADQGDRKQRDADREAARVQRDADCRLDTECWHRVNRSSLETDCARLIEGSAKIDTKWTYSVWDGTRMFNTISGPPGGKLTGEGNQARMQNAFGVWMPVNYACEYDPATKRARLISVTEGR